MSYSYPNNVVPKATECRCRHDGRIDGCIVAIAEYFPNENGRQQRRARKTDAKQQGPRIYLEDYKKNKP